MENRVLFEDFEIPGTVLPGVMDELWAQGWRHFGRQFFRYNFNVHAGELQSIIPLRIELGTFYFSKNQKRVLRKNEDLCWQWRPAQVNERIEALFEKHKQRFKDNVPAGLYEFISSQPACVPCHCDILACDLSGHLAAVSYYDVDAVSTSSVYGMFDPDFSDRSLGIFTLLKEIECSILAGKKWHYLGYATLEPGIYDYKKRFSALQGYDWNRERWLKYPFEAANVSS